MLGDPRFPPSSPAQKHRPCDALAAAKTPFFCEDLPLKPQLLLLPGLLCDAAVWPHQQQHLSAHAASTIADYGQLDTIEAMAAHALRLLPSGDLLVVGHSMGGRVALEIARQAPERVRKLVLMDTGTDPISTDAARARQEADKRMALLATARSQGMRAMGEAWAKGMVLPSRLDTPLFEDILQMIERKTPDIVAAQIQALLHRPDARAGFASLRCPTLVMCGRQDAWSPLQRHEEMHRALPGSTLHVIEDSGHMSTMEQPEAVSSALAQWLFA